MARPLRIQYPGAFYHITSRGNERKDVFKIKKDRERFLSYLESSTKRYGARIHAYCLMNNHYHLLVETPEGNLSQIMRHINGAYTTYFNIKRKRSGHLFQGRYNAILVDADEYVTQLSRYIHLNPVRAGMVEEPGKHPWSSFQYYAGNNKSPGWLVMDFVLGFFGENNVKAKTAYRQFVMALINREYESPLNEVVASTILGSQEFVKDIREKFLGKAKKDRNVPAVRELTSGKDVKEIKDAVALVFNDNPQLARKAAVYISHRYSGRKLKEIGLHFDIGESAVSQTSRRFAEIVAKDRGIMKRIEKLNRELGLSSV